MPVTKTAKRALRTSKRKAQINARMRKSLEAAIRIAKRDKGKKDIVSAISLTDRAAKEHIIHKNRAARIKNALSKLLPKQKAIQARPKSKNKQRKPRSSKSSSGRKK